jgi:hypothetical protein
MLIMHFEGGLPEPWAGVLGRFLERARPRIEARRRAREVKIAPSRFVDRMREISDRSDLGRMLEVDWPAALTRMSTDSCTGQYTGPGTQLPRKETHHLPLQLPHPPPRR